MPEDMLCPRQILESLTAAIYGDLQQHHADSQYLSEQAILTLKNKDGDAINDLILIFSQRGNSAVEFECGQSGREPRKC
ncbi:TPA: hypothetical protein ACH3X2_010574 [Trebouxia sp. C0005]